MTRVPPATRYPMVIEWSPDDDAFVVTVPDLEGCMAHGDTPQEAAKQAQVAIGLWLRTAAEFGRPIPPADWHLVSA